MDITLEDIGKRYNHRWVFRHISLEIESGRRLAVTGHNGSGKSTLLQIIMGALPQSEGSIGYNNTDGRIQRGTAAQQFTIAAPYVDLIEEMRIGEFLAFHKKLRRLKTTETEFVDGLGRAFSPRQFISELSSGMRQRLKLQLAILTESQVVILDEPSSNLDVQGKRWFKETLDRFITGETLIIASNDEEDLDVCTSRLHVPDYGVASSSK